MLDADDLERLGQFERYQRRRRRRRLLPDHPRHRAPAGRLLHPRHRPQREVGLQRAARGLEEEPRPPGAASSRRPAGQLPAPVDRGRRRRQGRPDRLRRRPTAAVVEARDQLREQGIPTEYCRLRALPVADEVASFVDAAPAGLRRRAEPRRPGRLAAPRRRSRGTLADRLVPVTHYNGTPIAAENIVRPDPRLGEAPLRARLADRQRRARQPDVPHADELSPE